VACEKVELPMTITKQTTNHDRVNLVVYANTVASAYPFGEHQLDKIDLAQLLKPYSLSRRSSLIANLLA
jgi:hypothetical protein